MSDGTSHVGRGTDRSLFCGNCDDCPFRNPEKYEPVKRDHVAALVYATLGYAVYPTYHKHMGQSSGMKQYIPQGSKGGFHLATTDIDLINEWAPFWYRSDTNIGLATGLASRLVVLDLDVKASDEAPPIVSLTDPMAGAKPRTFADLQNMAVRTDPMSVDPHVSISKWEERSGVTIPRSAEVSTPGHGTHYWMRLPETWTEPVTRRIGWLNEVDLLWDKHSIKVPPSVRAATDRKDAGEYSFTSGCPCQVPTASEDLLTKIVDTPSAASVGSGRGNGEAGASLDIELMKKNGIPKGEQNITLTRVAASLAARGRSVNEILPALIEIADASEQDPHHPWTTEQLRQLARSGWQFVYNARKRESQELSGSLRWAQSLSRSPRKA